jgi:hypothetical protein
MSEQRETGQWGQDTHQDFLVAHQNSMAAVSVDSTKLEQGVRQAHPDERPPSADDQYTIGENEYDYYPKDENGRLTSSAQVAYVKAMDKSANAVIINDAKRSSCLTGIMKTVSPEMRRNLNNIPGATEAIGRHLLHEMWPLLVR